MDDIVSGEVDTVALQRGVINVVASAVIHRQIVVAAAPLRQIARCDTITPDALQMHWAQCHPSTMQRFQGLHDLPEWARCDVARQYDGAIR